jgi:hypothetical protein
VSVLTQAFVWTADYPGRGALQQAVFQQHRRSGGVARGSPVRDSVHCEQVSVAGDYRVGLCRVAILPDQLWLDTHTQTLFELNMVQ